MAVPGSGMLQMASAQRLVALAVGLVKKHDPKLVVVYSAPTLFVGL